MRRNLAILVILIGVVGIVLGGVFIFQGTAKSNLLKEAMQTEQITLGIEEGDINEGEVIDTADEALAAGDTVREHRHGISPTYGDLLGEGRFDPANAQQLTYAQALNLENYLYLAVLSFGFTQSIIASGVFMVLMGIALISIGYLQNKSA